MRGSIALAWLLALLVAAPAARAQPEVPDEGEAPADEAEPDDSEAPEAEPTDDDAAPAADEAAEPQAEPTDEDAAPEAEPGDPEPEPPAEPERAYTQEVPEEDDPVVDELIAREAPTAPEEDAEDTPEGELAPASIAEEELDFWGGPRWHVAGIVDLGFLYLRPKFYLGWGTPHDAFIALEVNPLISGRGFGAYGGLRGELPFGELRVGARYFFTFTRSFLQAMDSFDHLQVVDRTGPPSRYLSLEAQLGVDVPIGPINIASEVTATYVALTDPGFFVFEEDLRIIVAPPFIWSANLGLRIRFGDDDEFYIQPMAEIVHLVNRNDFVLRVGLRAGVHLWPDLDVRLLAMPAVASPDSLGAAASDTFLMGIRYRWATDRPEDPDDDTVEE